MKISESVALSTYSLKQAINTSVIQKAVHQDAESVEAIMEMVNNTTELTGLGGKLDLRV